MDEIHWINGIKPEITEDSVRNYGHRTWANAEWSDITLAFAADFKSPGEITTKKAAGDKFIGYLLTSAEVMREQEDCYWKAQINGSLCHITATFGNAIAGMIINHIIDIGTR